MPVKVRQPTQRWVVFAVMLPSFYLKQICMQTQQASAALTLPHNEKSQQIIDTLLFDFTEQEIEYLLHLQQLNTVQDKTLTPDQYADILHLNYHLRLLVGLVHQGLENAGAE